MNPLKKFVVVASFVTSLPLGGSYEDLGRAGAGIAAYLPAVGILLGLALCSVAFLWQILHIPALPGAVVLLLLWLYLTGAIHFDGLMDTADGIFSHRQRSRMLEIMCDSRVGNFGAIAGWCALITKFVAIGSVSGSIQLAALFLIPTWSRWCATCAIAAFPYLREHGMGKIWHDSTRHPRDVLAAAVAPLVVSGAACYFAGTAAIVASLATVTVGLCASSRIASVLGGHTGDTYGAVVEVAETGGLLVLALAAGALAP